MSLLISFRSEMLKTKRTATLYLCIAAAAIIPAITFLEHVVDTLEPETLRNPWQAFFMGGLQAIGFVILPMYVILTCTLLPQIEFRNNTWKQVLVSPQRQVSLFVSKFLVIQFYILLLLILFSGLMLSTASVGQLIKPDVVLFSSKSDWLLFSKTIANVYIAILGISAFQFWLGVRVRNFITPIGIGFALWVVAAMLLFEFKWEHIDKFFFAFPFLNLYPQPKFNPSFLAWCSFGYAALFLLLGFIDFRRKVIKA